VARYHIVVSSQFAGRDGITPLPNRLEHRQEVWNDFRYATRDPENKSGSTLNQPDDTSAHSPQRHPEETARRGRRGKDEIPVGEETGRHDNLNGEDGGRKGAEQGTGTQRTGRAGSKSEVAGMPLGRRLAELWEQVVSAT